MALLETKKLTKDFGGLRAVNMVDFTIARGQIVGLIGPNGSGKTTFFNLITGLMPATEGEILFENGCLSFVGMKPNEITAAGVCRTFQNQRLFNKMTVLDNVLVATYCRTRSGLFGSFLQTPKTKSEEEKVMKKGVELLSIFGTRLTSMIDQPAWTLSYANRRRLEIARALATDPVLLLLDEPSAGMNPSETVEIMHDIDKINKRGVTIILIEHDMVMVKGLCKKVVALDHGMKIAEGSYEEVLNSPQVIEAYIGRIA